MSTTTGSMARIVRRVRSSMEHGLEGLSARLERHASIHNGLSPVRLTVVLVQWDPTAAAVALGAIESRLAELALEPTIYVVDNAAAGRSEDGNGQPQRFVASDNHEHAPRRIPGDNREREFSGWQRGIDQARADGVLTDVWLLCNDRFPANRYSFLTWFSGAVASFAAEVPAVVGFIDRLPWAVTSFGVEVSAWVRTTFFLVPDGVLDLLGGPVSLTHDGMQAVLPNEFPGPTAVFPSDGPIGDDHARWLVSFLTHAPDPDYGAHWYRQLILDEPSWPEFRGKVMSILNEHLLSARLRAAGIPLLELSLVDRLCRLGPASPPVRRAVDAIRASPDDAARRFDRAVPRLRLAASARRAELTWRPGLRPRS